MEKKKRKKKDRVSIAYKHTRRVPKANKHTIKFILNPCETLGS